MNSPSDEIDLKLKQFAQLWNELESGLLHRQPPRSISVEVCHDSERYQLLGIWRDHGKWRLCYASHNADKVIAAPALPALPWKPVAECTLEIRIAMANATYIGQLRDEVDRTESFFIPRLEAAIKQLEQALGSEEEAK